MHPEAALTIGIYNGFFSLIGAPKIITRMIPNLIIPTVCQNQSPTHFMILSTHRYVPIEVNLIDNLTKMNSDEAHPQQSDHLTVCS